MDTDAGGQVARRWWLWGAVALTCLAACSEDHTALDPAATPNQGEGADAGAGADAGVVTVPDTAAGRQLTWLLQVLGERAGVAEESELAEHFTPEFLAAVPPAELRQTLSSFAALGPYTLLDVVTGTTENQLGALLAAGGQQYAVSLEVDAASGRIAGLLVEEAPDLEAGRPTTWAEVAASVESLAARTSYLVARLEGGACQPLHAARSDERLAIGSAFKLYVLAELGRQVQAGELGWDDTIVVRDALKSLPSGVLQDEPDGTERSVLDVATPMIAISDNTATDLLIDRLGRENVEASFERLGHAAPELNTPLLTTREFFLFKLDLPSDEVDGYLASDVAARRAFLESLAGRAPDAAAAASWMTPRRIDQIEWFASAGELCQALAGIATLAAEPGLEPLATILSTNPGVPVDPAQFPFVGFKGGSEPGVMSLNWLVRNPAGEAFFVGIGMNDMTDPLADPTPAVVTALGIFALLAGEAAAE